MTSIMVVLIVAIAVAGRVAQSRYRALGSAGYGAAPAAGAPETARLDAEVRQLKARVATLERIVTDRSSSLDREIEALRDRP